MKKILITGTAGFIGFHLVNRLSEENYDIYGLDNINDYYDISLKHARLEETGIDTKKIQNLESRIQNLESGTNKDEKDNINELEFIQSWKFKNYRFIKLDLTDKDGLEKLFKKEKFDFVIHLAAQAGVRYSLVNPQTYIDSNITGFFNLLETCREYTPEHLIFASSSSVYGNNDKVPFSEDDNTDHPISLYAATKKSNEVMAHAYSSLYQIPITGLRFFTVYGPWGRPDMAYYSFSDNISSEKPIKLFNYGKLRRDFTYIDDIVEIIYRVITIEKNSEKENKAKFSLFNAGNSNPVELEYFVSLIEKYLGKKAIYEFTNMQKGDVHITYADNSNLTQYIEYQPRTDIETGLFEFIKWYKLFNKL